MAASISDVWPLQDDRENSGGKACDWRTNIPWDISDRWEIHAQRIAHAVICPQIVDLLRIDEQEQVFADELDDIEVCCERWPSQREPEISLS